MTFSSATAVSWAEVVPGPFEGSLVGEVAAAEQHQKGRQNRADQQEMERSYGAVLRPAQGEPAAPLR